MNEEEGLYSTCKHLLSHRDISYNVRGFVPHEGRHCYSSLNERGSGALLVARDQGMFRKNDLDAHPIFVRSGAVALSALSSGDAQFYFGSANGSVLGAMAGGLDAVFVAGLANKLNGTFVVAPATYGFSVTVVIVAAILSGLVVRRRLDQLDLIGVLKTRE